MHQLVNDLENVLYAVLDHRLKERGREGLSLRLLLRAVLGYMRTMETDLLDVGCRTFATALGKHHGTIARLLPMLATSLRRHPDQSLPMPAAATPTPT